ncbi:putative disease resistance RPP13-like protein 1 [Rosa rugosa]|uniref:putative disease resistance RPP13-like protein 1 n=1 Tax=Rosa rugosa TaxID=74645 RepID=UPI002B404A85|nr:putative disease resistance RPP13-like protein 1 [Rosa rugosa]XP_062001013.1 putative disease resistance RPP13-like protein 1 [Rosa rugosa]
MGNLKDLQILTVFVVDKHTARDNLLELKKLQNLCGRLCISGLGDVVHGSALEAHILRDKKFLSDLVLNWGGRHDSEVGNNTVDEIEVLEKLQPHPNLERLIVTDYGGRFFPGWSGYYTSLRPRKALVYLELVDCVNCVSLPPLGQLPCLRELDISGLHGVLSIGSEFYYGDNTTRANKPFRSLQSLRFYDMSGWQEWCHVGGEEDEGGVFPSLVQLDVSDCPNLSGRLALDSFPMLKEVDLIRTNLSLVTRSRDSKLSLNQLRLQSCSKVVAFPSGGLHAPNLTEIEIRRYEKLSSLPEQMETLLPSLVSLSLWDCPELECVPEGGFPSKLKSLNIMDSKKLNAKSTQNMNKALRRLTSLEELRLDFDCDEECEKVDWFSEGLLPSTLDYLLIHRLKCEAIDGAKWFGHLNSLRSLEISNCSSLRCLPDCGLPSSLTHLFIHGCPLLEKRCQRETGEDWSKIAHISMILIDWHTI